MLLVCMLMFLCSRFCFFSVQFVVGPDSGLVGAVCYVLERRVSRGQVFYAKYV